MGAPSSVAMHVTDVAAAVVAALGLAETGLGAPLMIHNLCIRLWITFDHRSREQVKGTRCCSGPG